MKETKFKFTKARLSRLKCGKNQSGEPIVARYYDTHTPGLMFQVTAKHHRSFYFTFASPEKHRGNRKMSRAQWLGEFGQLVLEDARKRVNESAVLVSRGLDPIEELKRESDARKAESIANASQSERDIVWTLRYQFDNQGSAYWRYAKRRQLKQVDNAIKVMRKHFAHWMDSRMDSLTAADLQRWYDNAISAKRASNPKAKVGGVNRAAAYLQGVFSQLRQATAHDDAPFQANPFVGFYTIKEPREKITYLEPQELADMLSVLDDLTDERPDWDWFALLVRLALTTGCRKGEMMSATYRQFEKREGGVELYVPENKANRPHRVPIAPAMWSAIQAHRLKHAHRIDDYVFPRARGATHQAYDMREQWKALHERAALPDDFTFHSLRHCFAVNALKNGVRIETLRELLNHADIKTTQRYAHVLPETKVSAIDLIAQDVF